MLQWKLQWKGSDTTRALGVINLTGFGIPDMSDVCALAITDPGVYSGCLPNFPSGLAIGAMAGVEHSIDRIIAFGAFAGPAIFFTGSDGTHAGLQTRLDMTLPANEHAAFVLWGQVGYLPLGGGVRAIIPMAGAGIRIR